MAENSESFCHALAGFLENRLRVSVQCVGGVPWQEREKLFDSGEIHLLWLCGFPYVDKADTTPEELELLAVPVPRGERYQGRPVYFSDVIVGRDGPLRSFGDLRGASWAITSRAPIRDQCRSRASCPMATARKFLRRSGSVGSPLRFSRDGSARKVDAAAIDSTVLEWLVERRRSLAQPVRVIETLGPSPVPPWVITRRLPGALREEIRDIFLRMHSASFGRALLAGAGLERFVAAEDCDYDPVRTMARAAEKVSFLDFS